MTEEEISRIKKHIEIHARQERGAVIITRVLRKAVDELEHIAVLEKENAELKKESDFYNSERGNYKALYLKEVLKKNKAKEIIKDLCGMVRELNKPNVQLTNVDYSLAEAEQFLKDSKQEG